MSWKHPVLLSLVLSSSAVFAQAPETQELDGNIDWVYSYSEGRIQSRRTNKPMFVVIRCER